MTRYLVESGVVGDRPMWVPMTWPRDDRDDVIQTMDRFAHMQPNVFGPAGSRRLRVRAEGAVLVASDG